LPTYGYRCEACSREFEVSQRMTDEPEAACPTCGGTGRRLIFPVGIVFKGSGFYATDHRSQSGGGQAGKDGGSSGPSKTETTEKTEKTEKKPDKKAESKSESASSPAPSASGPATGSTG